MGELTMSNDCAMGLAYYAMENNITLAELEQGIEEIIDMTYGENDKPTIEEFVNKTAIMRDALVEA